MDAELADAHQQRPFAAESLPGTDPMPP